MGQGITQIASARPLEGMSVHLHLPKQASCHLELDDRCFAPFCKGCLATGKLCFWLDTGFREAQDTRPQVAILLLVRSQVTISLLLAGHRVQASTGHKVSGSDFIACEVPGHDFIAFGWTQGSGKHRTQGLR